MPLLSDRQQKLFEILQTRDRVTTGEIMSQFAISSATASRDVHALILTGLATKVSHGIKLASPAESQSREKKCVYCGGTVNERTVFIIRLKNGEQRSACCSHCGLKALDQAGFQTALASDFLYGRMVNARQAAYVMGSSVNLCCEPSVLCFASVDEAYCFLSGFGGSMYTMEAAISQLKDKMNL
jgi:hypothetical protein